MSDDQHSDSSSCRGIPVIATSLGCALLLVVVFYVYGKHRPAALGDGVLTATQRTENLNKLHANEQKLASGYSWVDQGKGVVRLPLSRAIELTVEELKSGSAAK